MAHCRTRCSTPWASQAKAALALQELADYENRFDGFERRLDHFCNIDGLRVPGRLARVDWMMRTLIVLALGVLGRLLFIH